MVSPPRQVAPHPLSGWGRPDGVEDGLTSAVACGADLFLEKPIGAAELLARVSDLLDGVPAWLARPAAAFQQPRPRAVP